MKMSKKQYKKYAEGKADKSPLIKDMINAFWIGGLICTIGQFFSQTFINMGIDRETSGTFTSITLVFLSATLTALNVYDKIAKVAGAGTLVPITGFANSVASPAIEAKTEGFVMGVGAKIFTIAGPVILYGITAGAVYGVVYWVSTWF